jgi:hypothetical protein
MGLRFSWDPQKAAPNPRKHGVSFPDAATAFADPLSVTIPDPDHSADEERFLLVGLTANRRLVVIAHSEHGNDIRLISAREATRRERETYEEGE